MKESSSYKITAGVRSFWIGFLLPIPLITLPSCFFELWAHGRWDQIVFGAGMMAVMIVLTSPITIPCSCLAVAFGKWQLKQPAPDAGAWLIRFMGFGAMLMLPFSILAYVAFGEMYRAFLFPSALGAVVAMPISVVWWRARGALSDDARSATDDHQLNRIYRAL